VYYHVHTHIEAKVNTKSERITLLGSQAFKAFLAKESRKEGISVSELVRRRCERAPTDDELALLALAGELRKATAEARQALEEGLSAANAVLNQVRQVRKVEKKAA
jgi:hypothetical protein